MLYLLHTGAEKECMVVDNEGFVDVKQILSFDKLVDLNCDWPMLSEAIESKNKGKNMFTVKHNQD